MSAAAVVIYRGRADNGMCATQSKSNTANVQKTTENGREFIINWYCTRIPHLPWSRCVAEK